MSQVSQNICFHPRAPAAPGRKPAHKRLSPAHVLAAHQVLSRPSFRLLVTYCLEYLHDLKFGVPGFVYSQTCQICDPGVSLSLTAASSCIFESSLGFEQHGIVPTCTIPPCFD